MSIYVFDPEDAKRFGREQNIRYRVHGDELQFVECPYCRGATKDKNTFSISLVTGQFKCLRASCDAHGNMLTLMKDFNFSLGREVDEYYNNPGKARRYRTLPRRPPLKPTPFAEEWLQGRGISPEVTRRYQITTRKDRERVLLFPFYDENNALQFIKYRNTDPDAIKKYGKEYSQPNCKPILFGMAQCNPENKTLILTEGQIDSLSVTEAGIENAVSVPTGAKGFTWVPYCWDFLGKFSELIVFGDHEREKITLLEEMQGRFRGTIKHVRPEDYRGCKDANELLQAHGKEAVRAAVKNAVRVPDRRIIPLAQVKRRDLSTLEKFPTGIYTLDKILGGMYMGQLVILTGARGEGKSTVASQIAGQALQYNFPVFFYSGELEAWYFRDWFDRQIAGGRHINGKVNEYQTTEWAVDINALDAISAWYSEKMYIYDNSILASGDEKNELLKTVERSITQFGCRAIFLDNLMTAVEYDPHGDYYMQQTEFVRALALMAKRFNVLIMLIAHPRKASGRTFDSDEVAGSANVTNLADVVLRYNRPEKEIHMPKSKRHRKGEQDPEEDEDDQDDPTRELQVLKNRLTGQRTRARQIMLDFDPASKRIAQVGDRFDWRLGWENGYTGDAAGFMEANEGNEEIPF